MGLKLPDPSPGQPILAEHIKAIVEALQEIDIRAIPPLVVGPNNTLYLSDRPGFWIQITGAPSGTKHPWRQVVSATGGTWANATATGTTSVDPAYEVNGSTATLTNKYARAWRDKATGEVRFHYSTC